MSRHADKSVSSTLAELVEERTGVRAARCYQCGKCAAGCPLAGEMDLAPSQVLRLLQLREEGAGQEVLRSYGIWLCLACETCATRCPQEVDLPKVMDCLRQESLRRKLVHPRARTIVAFHRSFLDSIRLTGRLHEVGLVADYKLRTRKIWQDIRLAPKLWFRGKLHLRPFLIKDRASLAALFRRAEGGR